MQLADPLRREVRLSPDCFLGPHFEPDLQDVAVRGMEPSPPEDLLDLRGISQARVQQDVIGDGEDSGQRATDCDEDPGELLLVGEAGPIHAGLNVVGG